MNPHPPPPPRPRAPPEDVQRADILAHLRRAPDHARHQRFFSASQRAILKEMAREGIVDRYLNEPLRRGACCPVWVRLRLDEPAPAPAPAPVRLTRKQRDLLQAIVKQLNTLDGVVELDGSLYVYGRQVAPSRSSQETAQQLVELGVVTRAEAPGSRRVVVWGVRDRDEARDLVVIWSQRYQEMLADPDLAASAHTLLENDRARRSQPPSDPRPEPVLDSTPRRLILVGCGKAKLDRPAPARDLYTGTLTRDRLRYAEASGELWAIASAKHHVLWPDQTVEPYDLCLTDLKVKQREDWISTTALKLHSELVRRGLDPRACTVELHLSGDYAKGLAKGLRSHGLGVEEPVVGLSLPQSRAWYSARKLTSAPPPADTPAPVELPQEAVLIPCEPELARCPKCGQTATTPTELEAVFGFRRTPSYSDPERRRPQSQCKRCRGVHPKRADAPLGPGPHQLTLFGAA